MNDTKSKGVVVKVGMAISEGHVSRAAAKGKILARPRKGRRKHGFESIKGNEFSADNRFIFKERIIDRDNDLYMETIRDEDSGEILRAVKEKLSAHKGHGSAKNKP